jgi:beta-lactamase superfamily II metal-dependent hydrolase
MKTERKSSRRTGASRRLPSPAAHAKLRLKLIAVGHGDALLVHWEPQDGTPSTILIDGGPAGSAPRLTAALRELGAAKIDLAVLTHCDADHVDGLVEYAGMSDRLPITHFWGPCIPAFRRHGWLFPPRMNRGLDAAETLQGLMGSEVPVAYPVEGAQWVSADGDLVVRVLSPAARLIERLLVGTDSDELFLRYPTSLGWLFDAAPPLDPEDPFGGLRAALSSGEIVPAAIPGLPSARRTIGADSLGQAARQAGIDPEFFGNNVLNDTSIVLLVEARLGAVKRRLLFTGDLENFTYLMASYPNGIGCDIVKAPHHGSRSYIESSNPSYDEVWQWLRPKAALVSANGKHHLPRREFRDTVLRYGATLFCTCRRSREILLGSRDKESCNEQFGCNSLPQGSVGLTLTERTIEADAAACATGNVSGVIPIVQMIQHTIEPSNLLDRFTEAELRLHGTWLINELRAMHDARRRAVGEAGLSAVSMEALAEIATTAGRYVAAANIERIVDWAVRQGRAWRSPASIYRSAERKAWALPSEREWSELELWIKGYSVIQLAISDREVGLVAIELLRAADTGFLARRAAVKFAFPEEMFKTAIWPRLSAHLIGQRHVATRQFASGNITHVILLVSGNPHATYRTLLNILPRKCVHSFIQELRRPDNRYEYEGMWPIELQDIVTPFWIGSKLLMSHDSLSTLQGGYTEDWYLSGGIQTYVSQECSKVFQESQWDHSQRPLFEQAACEVFAASLVARLNVLQTHSEGPERPVGDL